MGFKVYVSHYFTCISCNQQLSTTKRYKKCGKGLGQCNSCRIHLLELSHQEVKKREQERFQAGFQV
jgi:hypothetical protein